MFQFPKMEKKLKSRTIKQKKIGRFRCHTVKLKIST